MLSVIMPAMSGPDSALETISNLERMSTNMSTPSRNSTPRSLTSSHRRLLPQTPRGQTTLKKTTSAPEFPPLPAPLSTSRPGSAKSRASRGGASAHRPGSSVGSQSGDERLGGGMPPRCASLPSVNDIGSDQPRKPVSYSLQRRRVSIVVEDPQNEITSALLDSARDSNRRQTANTADVTRLELSGGGKTTCLGKAGRSNSSSQQFSFTLKDPEKPVTEEANKKPFDPYNDPEWRQYSEKARQQRLQSGARSVNANRVYNLDPSLRNHKGNRPLSTKPTSSSDNKAPEPQTISEERVESMVNPVDTDFRIIKWIKECENAQRDGMLLPHLHYVDGESPKSAYENGIGMR